jgi:isopenicillin-N epimerase
MHTRREALALLGVSASAAQLPDSSLFAKDPERYWKRVRAEQFFLPEWRAYLNNGSLGVPPRSVVAAVSDYLRHGASLVDDEYPRWGYETLEKHRTTMAKFSGCHLDELAFTHNATEAMSVIADGLDLKAGDEILITDQEHPSGKSPWLKRQARHGVVVREVKIPLPPKNAAEVADIVISSIGPRTKVLSFSGILTTTGLIMPVREICKAARAKGVISVVDGAHMTGQIPFQLAELECDFFAGSPHKWLFAAPGAGLLYIRRENLERLWPGTVTGGWDEKKLHAARFMMVGTNNRAVFEGMLAGLDFQQSIGASRVYERIHQLAKMVYSHARELSYLKMLTPEDDTLYGGLVAFELTPKDTSKFFDECVKRRIWVMKNPRLRVATHIHTRPSDIDAMFGVMKDVFGKA